MSTLIDTNPPHGEGTLPRAARGRTAARALSTLRTLGVAALVAGLGFTVGCASDPACRKAGTRGAIVTGARTAGEAMEEGAKTAVEGVKTGGKAVGGFVEGGAPKAESEWNKGKAETKEVAREGAEEIDEEANLPICKEDS